MPKTSNVNRSRHIHNVRLNGDFEIVLRKPDDVQISICMEDHQFSASLRCMYA